MSHIISVRGLHIIVKEFEDVQPILFCFEIYLHRLGTGFFPIEVQVDSVQISVVLVCVISGKVDLVETEHHKAIDINFDPAIEYLKIVLVLAFHSSDALRMASGVICRLIWGGW